MKQKHISSLSCKRDRKLLEKRRMRAIRLYRKGKTQYQIAKKLKVSFEAVSNWVELYKKRGLGGLKSLGKPGPKSKLTEKNKQKIKAAIVKGPRAAGYSTDIWTLSRIASLIRKLTRKTFKITQTWRIVVSLGFTCQKPVTRNKERDEAAINHWKENIFPSLKKWAAKYRYLLGFHDESGVSERPTVRKTWSLKGKTPVIQSTGSWKNLSLLATIACTPSGRKPNLFLKSQAGNINAPAVINYLKELKKHLSDKKLLLFWDGLPAHRAILVKDYLKKEKSWLKVVRMPAYAPELNPPEYLWSSMKAKDVCNLRPDGLKNLEKAVGKGYRRAKRQPDLLIGFLKASQLF